MLYFLYSTVAIADTVLAVSLSLPTDCSSVTCDRHTGTDYLYLSTHSKLRTTTEQVTHYNTGSCIL